MSRWERDQWKTVSRSTWCTHKVFANLTTQIKWQAPKHRTSALTKKKNLTVESVQIREKTKDSALRKFWAVTCQIILRHSSFRLSNSVTRPFILDPHVQTTSSFRIAGSVLAHLFMRHVCLFHWLSVCHLFLFTSAATLAWNGTF